MGGGCELNSWWCQLGGCSGESMIDSEISMSYVSIGDELLISSVFNIVKLMEHMIIDRDCKFKTTHSMHLILDQRTESVGNIKGNDTRMVKLTVSKWDFQLCTIYPRKSPLRQCEEYVSNYHLLRARSWSSLIGIAQGVAHLLMKFLVV